MLPDIKTTQTISLVEILRATDTPPVIDATVLRFCRSISNEAPLYLRVKPVSKGKVGYCFDNVARQVRRERGSVAYGWAIWQWPGKYLEAEHHGVWRRPGGSLLDVSPQLNGQLKVLFLPDSSAVFDPSSFRSNILEPDGDDPLALEFVDAGRQHMAITNRHRAPGVTHAPLSPGDALRLQHLQVQMQNLIRRMNE